MPKNAINYANTIIYKLVCNDLDIKDCYVGHTTGFTKRKALHKHNSNENSKNSHFKVYKKIREHGGWDNWSMIEIEKFPCKDRNEACAQERYWLEKLNANLNSQIPNRSKKEYRQENKAQLSADGKKYYQENREPLLEYGKKYKLSNKVRLTQKNQCECGGCYTTINKSIHLNTKKHQKYLAEQQQNDPQINSNLNI